MLELLVKFIYNSLMDEKIVVYQTNKLYFI